MAEKKKSGGGRIGKFFTSKKYRPWVIGGVVIIGAIVLLSLVRPRSGSSAGAGVSVVPGGPSEQAQLAMAQIQAGLQASQSETQAAVTAASLGAAVEEARILTEGNIAQTQASTALEVARLETLALTAATEAQLDSQTQIELANIEARKFEAAQAAEIAFGDQSMNVAGILAGRDVALAEQDTIRQGIASQHEERMFGLQKAKRKHVGAILAGESPQLGTKTGSILGAIGGIFSDLRVKDDVEWSGVYDGVNRYTYYNEKTGTVEAGVMAHEVHNRYHVPMGEYMGVDYIALNAETEKPHG